MVGGGEYYFYPSPELKGGDLHQVWAVCPGEFEGLNFVYKFNVATKRMRGWSDRVVKDIPVNQFIKVYKLHHTSDCCALIIIIVLNHR